MSNLSSLNPASLKILFTEEVYFIQERKRAILEQQTNSESVEDSIPKVKIDEQTFSFNYIGDNNKYFLVLHDDKVHTRMNPLHQEMLLKVMAAKNLGLRDLAIVNISRYPDVKFDSLKNFFGCTRVAFFGIQPSHLGISGFSLNKEQLMGGVRMLATYSLEEMRNDGDKKREFWNVMKSF